MKDILSKGGYDVKHFEDLSDKQIKKVVYNISVDIPDEVDCDSFIMYFSGHGYGDKILGHDVDLDFASESGFGVEISQLVHHFQPQNCRSLEGKPKIFLRDCRRGGEKDTSKGGSWALLAQQQAEFLVPKFTDSLYGYASAPSFVAYTGDNETTNGMSVWTYFLQNDLRKTGGTAFC
eukprot:TRINITY_DN314_c0_g1_i2.p1 TRINITY_DN314_c0_g1~~TRINITY_DN314_c0_g1_i2.p1  ORF type:complete len:177 (+),score=22.99 TRINITY_DN314_c0_g1_i2:762-1292(+)